MELREGEIVEYERTFTHDDVRQFSEVSGDAGEHHVEPDDEGRLMVQGLLTATLPTKIGGDLDFVARRMEFGFVRPVYTGDTVTCRTTAENVREREDRTEATIDFTCHNQDDEVVLEGWSMAWFSTDDSRPDKSGPGGMKGRGGVDPSPAT